MEITYQNKNEDLDAYFEYFINETETGKKYSLSMLLMSQVIIFIIAVIIGGITFLISGLAKDGVFWGVFFLFVLEFSFFSNLAISPDTTSQELHLKKKKNPDQKMTNFLSSCQGNA
jgi:hypothetical protein